MALAFTKIRALNVTGETVRSPESTSSRRNICRSPAAQFAQTMLFVEAYLYHVCMKLASGKSSVSSSTFRRDGGVCRIANESYSVLVFKWSRQSFRFATLSGFVDWPVSQRTSDKKGLRESWEGNGYGEPHTLAVQNSAHQCNFYNQSQKTALAAKIGTQLFPDFILLELVRSAFSDLQTLRAKEFQIKKTRTST